MSFMTLADQRLWLHTGVKKNNRIRGPIISRIMPVQGMYNQNIFLLLRNGGDSADFVAQAIIIVPQTRVYNLAWDNINSLQCRISNGAVQAIRLARHHIEKDAAGVEHHEIQLYRFNRNHEETISVCQWATSDRPDILPSIEVRILITARPCLSPRQFIEDYIISFTMNPVGIQCQTRMDAIIDVLKWRLE